jgi:hypothetical protein
MKDQHQDASETRDTEPYSFSKDKLPKMLSYPLKRSLLDFALQSAGVYDAVYSVLYVGRPYLNMVLHASFTPDWKGHPTVRGRCLIIVRAIRSDERLAAEQLLLGEGIPILCRWLRRTQHEGNVWRSTEHTLTLEIENGKLSHYFDE